MLLPGDCTEWGRHGVVMGYGERTKVVFQVFSLNEVVVPNLLAGQTRIHGCCGPPPPSFVFPGLHMSPTTTEGSRVIGQSLFVQYMYKLQDYTPALSPRVIHTVLLSLTQ